MTRSILCCLYSLAAIVALTCSQSVLAAPPKSKPHDHAGHSHAGHDHLHLCEEDIEMPEDFVAAVQRIKACRDSIKSEIQAGHYDELHHPLDEATIILGKLMPIARDSGIPKPRWQEVNLAAKDLKKRFGELHVAVDKQRKLDYSKVAQPIDAALRRLEAVADSSPSTAKRAQPAQR